FPFARSFPSRRSSDLGFSGIFGVEPLCPFLYNSAAFTKGAARGSSSVPKSIPARIVLWQLAIAIASAALCGFWLGGRWAAAAFTGGAIGALLRDRKSVV